MIVPPSTPDHRNARSAASAKAAHRDLTGLLRAWNGDQRAVEAELLPLVYHELRQLAGSLMRRERSSHTLQVTGLVHEAYLRLAKQRDAVWLNRQQFFCVAAQLMRRILVDHGRRRSALRRGSSPSPLTLDEAALLPASQPFDVLDVDRALRELEALDPSKARLVELRFFAGLPMEEVADVLGISESTAARQWRTARAWLFRRLG